MRLITLGSTKNGCGKSFVTVVLGAALARRGLRTCVVDLDLGSADLGLMTGVFGRPHSVQDLLSGAISSLDEAMCEVPGLRRLHVIPGPRETVCASSLSAEEIARLGGELTRLPVDVVLADLPAGAGQQVLDLFLLGDQQWVVATNEEASLAEAQRLLRLARLRRTTRGSVASRPERPRVYTSLDDLVRDMNALRQDSVGLRGVEFSPGLVINRARADQPDEEQRLLEGVFGGSQPADDPPLIGMLPDDPAALFLGEAHAPLTRLPRQSPAVRAAEAIAAALHDDLQTDTPCAEEKAEVLSSLLTLS